MLEVLKYVALILGAAFGILGITSDYKDKSTGKVTPWGKVAIFGVIISAMVTLGSQFLEDRAETAADAQKAAFAKEQQEVLKKQTEISNEVAKVARITDPLEAIGIEFWIDFPRPEEVGLDDNDSVKPYLRRLDQAVVQIVKQSAKPFGPQPGREYGFVSLFESHSGNSLGEKLPGATRVTIPAGSSLLPSPKETVPFILVSNVSFYIDIYVNPIDNKHLWSASDWHNEAPFFSSGQSILANTPALQVGTQFDLTSVKSNCELLYLVQTHHIAIHCKKNVSRDSWVGNDEIRYVQDLFSKQMFLRWQLGKYDYTAANARDLGTPKIVLKPIALLFAGYSTMAAAIISINGHEYEFSGKDKRLDPQSNYLDIVLPASRQGLDEFTAQR